VRLKKSSRYHKATRTFYEAIATAPRPPCSSFDRSTIVHKRMTGGFSCKMIGCLYFSQDVVKRAREASVNMSVLGDEGQRGATFRASPPRTPHCSQNFTKNRPNKRSDQRYEFSIRVDTNSLPVCLHHLDPAFFSGVIFYRFFDMENGRAVLTMSF